MKVEDVKWIAHVGNEIPSDVGFYDLCIAKCYYADEKNGFYVEVFDTNEIDWHIWNADGDIMEYVPLHGYTRYFSTGALGEDERISLATKSGRIYTVSPNEWNINRINIIPSTEDILCAKRYCVQVKSLGDAILDAVKELTDECGSFSIWEITKRIRHHVINEDYTTSPFRHYDVKQTFLNIDKWSNYTIEPKTYKGATYRYYVLNTTSVAQPKNTSTTTSVSIDVPLNVFKTYLANRGKPTTMKQLQSRFKVGKCGEWVDYCKSCGQPIVEAIAPSKAYTV